MARARPQETLRAALFDRLSVAHGSRGANGEVGLREIHEAVTRDLERLLNSRVWWPGDLDDFEEASESLLKYGLSDLSAFSWVSKADANSIVAIIERAIKTFEPRLMSRSVRVALLEREAVDDFRVRLRIEAILHVEPHTERVAFDTEFDADTGTVRVKGSL